MNESVRNSIKHLYEEKDYTLFRKRCNRMPAYVDGLIKISKLLCRRSDIYNDKDDPCVTVWFYMDEFIKGDFCVQYLTLLKISKVSDLFVIQHEFNVENKDPNRLMPDLNGFGGQAYVFAQEKLDGLVTNYLINHELKKLDLYEMDEVISNLEMPSDSIFGTQMTVENALFRDIYGICESE